MKKGYLITLEGGEGSGKSSVGKELLDYIKSLGLNVQFLREPGGTVVSERIRDILKDKSLDNMSIKTELLLFLAARAQIAEEVIRPLLREGWVVILDRFRDSTDVYQGYARGLGMERTSELNDWATDFLSPNLTLLFDVDPEVGLKRKGRLAETDRLDSLGLEFHQKVREGYAERRRMDRGGRWYTIDAGMSKEEVLHEAQRVVAERLTQDGLLEGPNTRKEARG